MVFRHSLQNSIDVFYMNTACAGASDILLAVFCRITSSSKAYPENPDNFLLHALVLVAHCLLVESHVA